MNNINTFSEFLKENNNTIEFIYHGTTKGAALRIQKDGLKPHNTGEELASISFTDDLIYAEYFAKMKGGKNGVILRTLLTHDFKLSNRIRNNKGDEYITFKPILAIDLEILTPMGNWVVLTKWNIIFDEPLV